MNLDLPIRPRRLRRTEGIRRMVRETTLRPENLVAPLFLTEGADLDVAVPSMPGVRRMSVDVAATEAARLAELGIGAVLLFGIPETKDATGSSAWDPDGVVQRGIGAIRSTVPDLPIITDVCLCEYTDHGHCGLLDGEEILNDASVALYARTALSHAVAGADIVAPSDMMDGRGAAIREVLDD